MIENDIEILSSYAVDMLYLNLDHRTVRVEVPIFYEKQLRSNQRLYAKT